MKPSNSQSIKAENIRLVMRKLIELRETSRVELAKTTTLTKKTVSSIINELIEKDLVVETNRCVKTSGRSAQVIALNKNAGRIISIELLTTSIYGIISNIYGEILYEVRREIHSPHFPPYLKILLETIDELKENTYVSPYGLIGIGVAVYGILSKNKKIKFAPFVSWKDIDLKSIIEEYVGVKSFIENEANISALGELMMFPDYDNIITINIGIGVGMGIIINGKLYTGEDGFAGEIGHTTVVPNGKACVCGNYGCLETYISDTAIISSYHKETSKTITLDQFIELYKNKDTTATTIYKEFINKLSVAVSNIAHLFNPKMIIISSQIVEGIPESISLIKNNLRSQIMSLDVLTVSKHQSKTNVLGLTHAIIQDFLSVDDYHL
ncbi:MAG: ROK family protein [Acholeplasmataceae bacterium]